jgi:acyl dehydratase
VHTWTTVAANDATHSENRIHDDATARQYGFLGGLVPGVTVFAIGVRPLADRWGEELLERGHVDFRLAAPVYEGGTVEARLDGNAFRVLDEAGTVCLDGTAALDDVAVPFPEVEIGGELPRPRPEAGESSLAPGTVLAPVTVPATDRYRGYLELLGDDHPLWTEQHLVHPGWLCRALNEVLSSNVLLGPWIHVGTDLHLHGAAHEDEVLETRAVVTDNFERKGHHFVTVRGVTVEQAAGRPVLSGTHTAIWRPRPVG